MYLQSLFHSVCLYFQTEEALFAALRLIFFHYTWPTSPINDDTLLCFRFNEVYCALLDIVK